MEVAIPMQRHVKIHSHCNECVHDSRELLGALFHNWSVMKPSSGSRETASVVQWSEFLATDPEVRVRFPALPDILTSSGFGTGSTQPCEYN
jgi:hypothetical protein